MREVRLRLEEEGPLKEIVDKTLADARAKQVSGMTRFDLEERITVPNGSSTMVAILNRQVDAEQTFLYRPGGAGNRLIERDPDVGFEVGPTSRAGRTAALWQPVAREGFVINNNGAKRGHACMQTAIRKTTQAPPLNPAAHRH